MALVAVLWMVAAMGLIITGIVHSVRGEIRTVALQRQALVANALADAAILLALQSLLMQPKEASNGMQTLQVPFENTTSEVSVQPLNGLIDINNAPAPLLAEMYLHAAGLNPDAAQTMAKATVDFRQLKNAKGTTQGFDSTEDLLRVPQMTYDLYAKINMLISAEVKNGSGRINPLAAPAGVVQILTNGDALRAAALLAQRKADPKLMDTSSIKPEHIDMTASPSLRLQVRVNLPDGGAVQKRWNVYLAPDPRTNLPWRVISTSHLVLSTTPQ